MKSLDKLVQTMKDEDFVYTRREFVDDAEFNLMTKKGIFPYDFFDSIEKLQYSSFPSCETFYNMLNDEECTIKVSL